MCRKSRLVESVQPLCELALEALFVKALPACHDYDIRPCDADASGKYTVRCQN